MYFIHSYKNTKIDFQSNLFFSSFEWAKDQRFNKYLKTRANETKQLPYVCVWIDTARGTGSEKIQVVMI